MRNEIKTDKFLDGIQIRHKIIKDATGVDLTTAITGAVRISTVFDQYANTARKIPKNIAKRNPVTIRTKLNPTDYLVAKVEKLEAAVRELTEDEEDESSKFSVEELAIILDMDEEEIRDVLRLTGDDK